MNCSFRGRRSTSDVSIVTLRGRRSTWDVSCCVFFCESHCQGCVKWRQGAKFRGRRGILWDVLKIDGSLARNIDFEVANFQVLRKTRRKTSILKLQSVKNWRKSRRKCSFWCSHVSRLESLVFLWPRRVSGGSCKTSPFRRFLSRLSCRFAWQAWHFVTFQPVWRVESRFVWQAQYFCDVFPRWVAVFVAGAALRTCPSSLCMAGAALHTLHSTLHTLTSHSTLYIPHFTLYTPHSTLYTPHFTLYTLHITLYTPHSTLHTPQFRVYTPHFTLHTLHFRLHTPHFTL